MSSQPPPGPNLGRTPACGLLAAIILLIGDFPVAAQSGSAAVVCVGSERRALQSAGPVRRVITEDVAVAYRVGVGADDREGMEQSLIGELGDPAEASCAWSGPGDNYVVIIQYTGAIRLDLMLDPDDPRFQAFAVGYGASAEAAEENATRVDAPFLDVRRRERLRGAGRGELGHRRGRRGRRQPPGRGAGSRSGGCRRTARRGRPDPGHRI